jgi:hypothetical protein
MRKTGRLVIGSERALQFLPMVKADIDSLREHWRIPRFNFRR